MGTNYYSVKRGVEELDGDAFWELRDGEGDSVLHIGKSSGGWCFSLHVIPECGINDLWDWFDLLLDPDRIIVNEYREVISFSEMFRKITQRGRPDDNRWTERILQQNHAELGPNNLVRHQIGHGCVKHGAGTWDCITGRFS
jgi:hypothetical protein